MKLILKLLGGLVVLVLLAVVASFFFPHSYRVERTAVINAKPETVFAQIADLKAWKNWSAWHERDPAMKISFSDQTSGVGAWTSWESKSEGNGKMTVTTHDTPKKVAYKLEFPDMHMISDGVMELQPAEKGVRVAWSTAGDLGYNPINRWFGLFMDKLIGPDFEKGLAKLKAVTEAAK